MQIKEIKYYITIGNYKKIMVSKKEYDTFNKVKWDKVKYAKFVTKIINRCIDYYMEYKL